MQLTCSSLCVSWKKRRWGKREQKEGWTLNQKVFHTKHVHTVQKWPLKTERKMLDESSARGDSLLTQSYLVLWNKTAYTLHKSLTYALLSPPLILITINTLHQNVSTTWPYTLTHTVLWRFIMDVLNPVIIRNITLNQQTQQFYDRSYLCPQPTWLSPSRSLTSLPLKQTADSACSRLRVFTW